MKNRQGPGFVLQVLHSGLKKLSSEQQSREALKKADEQVNSERDAPDSNSSSSVV